MKIKRSRERETEIKRETERKRERERVAFQRVALLVRADVFGALARVSLPDDIGEVLVFKATFGKNEEKNISQRFYLHITCTHRSALYTEQSSRSQSHLREVPMQARQNGVPTPQKGEPKQTKTELAASYLRITCTHRSD